MRKKATNGQLYLKLYNELFNFSSFFISETFRLLNLKGIILWPIFVKEKRKEEYKKLVFRLLKKKYICFNNQQIVGKDVSVLHEYATAFTLYLMDF